MILVVNPDRVILFRKQVFLAEVILNIVSNKV